jgi:hypothetical protein
LPTLENFLRAAVEFIDISTLRTLTAGISWINCDHHHTCQLRFVFDKAPQLPERPATNFRSSGFLNPNPSANPVLRQNSFAFSFNNLGNGM